MMTAKRFGMLEEALVIVASDNGAMPGGGQGGSNWPLRGEKQTPFEVRFLLLGGGGVSDARAPPYSRDDAPTLSYPPRARPQGGVRVPALMYSESERIIPRHARGTRFDGLFHVSDWLPTIFVGSAHGDESMLTSSNHTIDGVNQWTALIQQSDDKFTPSKATSTATLPRRHLILQASYLEGVAAIISGDYKLVYFNDSSAAGWWNTTGANEHAHEIRDVTDPTHDGLYLFDLSSDPNERVNLVGSKSEDHHKARVSLQVAFCEYYATRVADSAWRTDDVDAWKTWLDSNGGFVSAWTTVNETTQWPVSRYGFGADHAFAAICT